MPDYASGTGNTSPWYSVRNSITGVVIGSGVTSIGTYAFYNCYYVTSVTMPETLTAIGDHAFNNCDELTVFDVPNSVTSIGVSAFQNSGGLTAVNIGEQVAVIGENAFLACTALTAINVASGNPNYSSESGILYNGGKTRLIQCPAAKEGTVAVPETVTALADYAFYNCIGLTGVQLPNSVSDIGNSCFRNCTELASVNIPSGVTIIKDRTFNTCRKLTLVTIPETVTEIGTYAFAGSGLTSVDIPAQVTSIGESGFYGCTNLEQVTIPDKVTGIGSQAFYGCSKLTGIVIPDAVTSIGNNAFYNCTGLTSATIGSSVATIGTLAFSGCSALTEVVNKAVTPQTIATGVFQSVPNTCTLRVPAESVELYKAADVWKGFGTIEAIAEPPCNNPTNEGTLSNGLEWKLCPDGTLTITGEGPMPDFSFNSSSPWISLDVKNAIVGNGITRIGNYAFEYCDMLVSVTIPESVTTIGDYAFLSCTVLPSVTIPNSVTAVAQYAFQNCTGLTSVTLGNSVATLGAGVFDKCSALALVEIPNSVTAIGSTAFSGCSSLASVTLGNSVASIGQSAFQNCTSLASITIPASVTYIGQSVFSGCSNLTAINVDAGNTEYSGEDGVLFNADKTQLLLCAGGKTDTYTMPNSVTAIANTAFQDCIKLTSVIIGNSVATIGQYAFRRCTGLTSVTLGSSVTRINYQAFDACSSLKSVDIAGSVTIIDSGAFRNCTALATVTNRAATPQTISDNRFTGVTLAACTLKVPAEAIALYEAAAVWTDFGTIEAIDESGAPCDNPIASGTTGTLAWMLCPTGTLTITGEGAMPDYVMAPWEVHKNSITSAVIGEGVTRIGEYAFSMLAEMTSVEIPNSVTSIGIWGFHGCEKLASITIPTSVTTIESNAFQFCNALTSVAIPASVTTLEDSVFFRCPALAAIEVASGNPAYSSDEGVLFNKDKTALLQCPEGKTGEYAAPEGTTSIEIIAFARSNLSSITLPNSVETIAEKAFYSSTLSSVTIGSSVTSIGDYAFCWCMSLNECTNRATTPQPVSANVFEYAWSIGGGTLRVPAESVELYEAAAVWTDFGAIEAIDEDGTPCDNPIAEGTTGTLAWMLCPDGTLTITGEGAIPDHSYVNPIPWNDHKSSITGVVIGDGVTRIGNYAFQECTVMATVSMGNTVTEIGEYAFFNCTALASITIPESTTTIGVYAFRSCTGLTEAVIGNSVTEISEYAFGDCSSLSSVSIGSSVAQIGSRAFNGCTALKSVTIPESVTGIGSFAFNGCTGLTSANIGSAVTSIGEYAFAECTALASVVIPNSVTVISSNTFYNCSGLTSVTIGSAVTSIGSEAFYGCSSLESVTIPNTVAEIGYSAFNGCTGLTSAVIGNAVTSIAFRSFYSTGLTSVTIPASVNTIGAAAFGNCSAMTAISVEAGNQNYAGENGVLFNIDKTQLLLYPAGKTGAYEIPASVTSMSDHSFNSCTGLTAVTGGEALTAVSFSAFYNCTGLTSVTIGSEVTTVDSEAFSGCTALSEIANYAVTPPTLGYSAFDGVNQAGCTLRVPAQSVELYQAADVWKDFGTIEAIVEDNFNYITETVNGVSFDMAAVEGGTFTMGATAEQNGENADDELPTHEVTLNGFLIGKTEVTQGLWHAVMGSYPGSGPTEAYGMGAEYPVYRVNWNEVMVFISTLNTMTGKNYRLPFESEWEYAARGGSHSKGYKYSGSNTATDVAWHYSNSQSTTHPAGGLAPNELGLYDMSGNVFEWVFDWYGDYSSEAQTNPQGPQSGSYRTYRGGGRGSMTNALRVSDRNMGTPTTQQVALGFRLARPLNSYTVSLSVNPTEGGTVDGSGTFNEGTVATVTATANANYTFVNWTENGAEVSDEAEYTFTVTANHTLVANFELTGDSPCDNPVASGITGNLTWTLCPDGTLHIAGEGDMPDYALGTSPWYEHRNDITTVIMENGITRIGNQAFRNCGSLTAATMPNTVTAIGNSAFEGSALTSINLSESLTAIGQYAFYSLSGLNSVTFPETLISIGVQAFYGCVLFTSIVIPDATTAVEDNAFGNCTGLTAVTIGSSVTTIANKAFSGCSALAEFTNKAAVPQTINANVFTDVNKTTCILRVPAQSVALYQAANVWKDFMNIEAIEGGNFEYITETVNGVSFEMAAVEGGTFTMGAQGIATPLHEVTLSGFYIGKYEVTQELWMAVMESNPSNFTGDNLPVEQVSRNDAQAFITALNGLTGKTYRLLTEAEWEYAARGGSQSESYNFSGSNTLTDVGWSGDNSNSTTHPAGEKLPNELGLYDMSGNVMEWVSDWYGAYTADAQTNPAGPETGTYGVLRGGDWSSYAVYDYHHNSYRMSYMPTTQNSVFGFRLAMSPEEDPCDTPIAEGTAGTLEWILCPDGMLTITGEGAIPDYEVHATPWDEHLAAITGIIIGEGVTAIGNQAFHFCTAATSVTMPGTLTRIGNSAFEECRNLPSVTIPNSVTEIGDYAFGTCNAFTSVTIPNQVVSIGERAFANCPGLTSATIPASVTSIGNGVFYYCPLLTAIEVETGNPNYSSDSGILFNKDKTTALQCPEGKTGEYTMPASTTSIAAEAFYSSNLSQIIIPNSVTSIGGWGFYGTALSSVTIGSSVTTIGVWSFAWNVNLVEVINHAVTPQTVNANVFNNVDQAACTLRVPAGSVAAYQDASVWKDFGTIEAIESGIDNRTLTGITVYGNKNSVHIANSHSISLKSVQITDALGRVVYDGRGRTFSTPAEVIPVNGASGIYIVRIVSDDNRVLSTKVHLNN
jgi:formylglycine-generating enzyme required for sulfatase activity